MLGERQVYSQQGEDGVIECIFETIGTTNKVAVDIGAYDGVTTSNTHLLKEQGWRTVQYEGSDVAARDPDVQRAWVTLKNVCGFLSKDNVPSDFDFLSLDIDSLDWWVLKSILEGNYRPRAVVTEVNGSYGAVLARVLAPDATAWGAHFGGSLLAFYYLLKAYGYNLVYMESNGVNAFWVHGDSSLPSLTPPEAYKPPKYGVEHEGMFLGHEDRGDTTMRVVTPDLRVL